jgi:hypothetical protein
MKKVRTKKKTKINQSKQLNLFSLLGEWKGRKKIVYEQNDIVMIDSVFMAALFSEEGLQI